MAKILVLFDRRWLVALLSVDVLLVAAHISSGLIATIPHMLNLSGEWGLAELFGYFEMGLAAALLLLVFVRLREPIMLAFAAMFACIMLDDLIGLHEIGGRFLSASLQFQATDWFRGEDMGELLVWAILAGLILPLVLYGFVRTPRNLWYRAFGLIVLTGVLVMFAVVVDMSHRGVCQLGGGFPYCDQWIYLIEDGGEKAAQSLILAHVVFLMRNASAPALFDLAQQLLPSRIGALLR